MSSWRRFLSCLRSDDVALSVPGAGLHQPAAYQLHAAVGAAVHQGLVPLHAALGSAAQRLRRSLHRPGRCASPLHLIVCGILVLTVRVAEDFIPADWSNWSSEEGSQCVGPVRTLIPR